MESIDIFDFLSKKIKRNKNKASWNPFKIASDVCSAVLFFLKAPVVGGCLTLLAHFPYISRTPLTFIPLTISSVFNVVPENGGSIIDLMSENGESVKDIVLENLNDIMPENGGNSVQDLVLENPNDVMVEDGESVNNVERGSHSSIQDENIF